MFAVVTRYAPFRRLWAAQVVSYAGDWLNRVAVLVLIGHLSGPGAAAATGALFGIELALRLLPVAVFGPFAGPVADRVPRRLLMVLADLSRAVIVLGFILVREPGDLPLLYTLIVLQMSLGIFFESARSASLPNVVPKESLHEAYVLSAATWSTMLAVGSLAGGVLLQFVGMRGVFLVDAATFGVSALLLTGLKLPPVPDHPEPFRWRDLVLLTDLRRGLAHARSLGITGVLATKTFWGPAGGYLVILGIAGTRKFGESEVAPPPPGASLDEAAAALSATGLATGILYAARGLGTGIGPITARFLFGTSERSLRWQISGSFALAALGYFLFAFTDGLAAASAAVVLAHAGGSTLWVSSTLLWQRVVDDAFRGRVFALDFLGMTVSFSAGGLIAGLCYDLTDSLSTTVFLVASLTLASGVLWSLMVHRRAG